MVHEAAFSVIHTEGNHWCLVFINFEKNTFTFIDPMKKNKKLVKKSFTNWKKFVAAHGIDIEEMDSDWSLKEYEYSIQRDSVNCGLYCLSFLELLIENRERKDLKIDFNGSVKKYFANKRNEMYNFFVNNV